MRDSTLFTDPPEPLDDYVSKLNQVVTNTIEMMAPMKSKTKRNRTAATSHWMTTTAKKSKRLKRRLERQYRKTKTEADYIAYRQASRSSVKAINNARADYFRDSIQKASSDPRSLWRTTNQLLHTSKQTPARTPEESETLARSFTTFFLNKLSQINSTITNSMANFQTALHPHPPLLPKPFSSFSLVTFKEALDQIKSQHASKSSPVDTVPSFLIKSCPQLFAEILKEIANRSFKQGIFPSSFKTAQITPLLKKPSLDPTDKIIRFQTNFQSCDSW